MVLYLVEETFVDGNLDIETIPLGIFTDEDSARNFAREFSVKNEDDKNFYGCSISKWEANDVSRVGKSGAKIEYVSWK